MIYGTPWSGVTEGFATGTDKVDVLSFGLNGWPNVHTRLMFDYVVNIFSDGVLVSGEKICFSSGRNMIFEFATSRAFKA